MSFAKVTVQIGDSVHHVIADRGGVIDSVVESTLEPGWQTFTFSVEGQQPVETTAFVVSESTRFGIVSDVDDTVMVTALPRPFIAA